MTIETTKKEIEGMCNSISNVQLEKIDSIVLFLGHAHSGHSIIGSTLDAHPDVAIANEINIVKVINDFKLTKKEIESLLLYYSLRNHKASGWRNSEYQYQLQNSYQGKTKHPLVIGDKKAGGTTRILLKNPWVLNYLLDKFNSKLKFIFVKRNPVDVVAAYSYYMKQEPSQFHVDRYLENLMTVQNIKKQVNQNQWQTIEQSNFLSNPKNIISNLFHFLKVDYNTSDVSLWTKNVLSNLPSKSSKIQINDFLRNQLI